MSIEAILFDLDGTLCDSVKAHVRAWLKAIESFGHRISSEVIMRFIGRSTLDIARELVRLGYASSPEELFERKRIYFLTECVDLVEPMNGVYEVLSSLKEYNLKLGVVSSSHRDAVVKILTKLNLLRYFDVVICSDDVSRGKPDPEGYLLACQLLGVVPNHVIGVGDTVYDVLACKRAGMIAIGFCSGVSTFSQLVSAGADYVITDLREVLYIVRSLTTRS